jgi:hypothetical protein
MKRLRLLLLTICAALVIYSGSAFAQESTQAPTAQSNQLIAVISLLIAFLAVFVSPFVSWITTKFQGKVAHRQMLGPMRQAWINELRKKLSVLIGRTTFYSFAGQHPVNIEEVYRELTEIQQEIELTINPREDDHRELVNTIAAMMKSFANKAPRDVFMAEQRKVVTLAQTIFKTEWNQVKDEDA